MTDLGGRPQAQVGGGFLSQRLLFFGGSVGGGDEVADDLQDRLPRLHGLVAHQAPAGPPPIALPLVDRRGAAKGR